MDISSHILTIISLYVFYVLVGVSLRGKQSGYLLLLGFLLALSSVGILEAWGLVSSQGYFGPGLMPLFCSTLLALLSIIEILRDVKRGLEPKRSTELVEFKMVMGSILIIGLYLSLLSYLGYFLATGLFVAGLSFCLGLRKIRSISGLTVAWLAFVYLVFVRLLGVPLPESSIF